MVVFPLVPVTPTNFSFSEGLPKKLEAPTPNTYAELSTLTYVTFSTVLRGSFSHTITEAPFSMAPSM